MAKKQTPSEIEQLVDQYLMQDVEEALENKQPLSLRIPERDSQRLDLLAEKLGTKRATLGQELLLIALREAVDAYAGQATDEQIRDEILREFYSRDRLAEPGRAGATVAELSKRKA